LEHKELTEKIISCAYRVYNKMGAGFLESVYEKCLVIELMKIGLFVDVQKSIQVFYEGKLVGDFVADMIVNNTIILELKAVKQLAKAHEVQLVNYLVATGKPVGLLINFGEDKVAIRRKVKELK
jgi:GxxExxY protein